MLVSGFCGIVFTIITQRILSKRSLFTYSVWHMRVGQSTDDAIFGSVKVTWNDSPVENLYLSSIEMQNSSLKDFENVTVRIYTGDTRLLTERTELVGTTQILTWSDEFISDITVESGEQPSELQNELHRTRREYTIPSFNRGQIARMTFLNAAQPNQQPSLWADVVHKGVKLKFRIAHNKFMGISQPYAALVGMIIGLIIVALLISKMDVVWIAATVSFLFGVFIIVPGALVVKLWYWIRERIGG